MHDWNTIRVTAFRDYLALAFNGKTVWSGYLGTSHFRSGNVGFRFLRDDEGMAGGTVNCDQRLWVDSAKLDTLSGQ